MARYTGPSWKLSRRLGISLNGTGKELEKRPYAPGQHGPNQRKKLSEYGLQLQEKQKLRHMYGVNERQFRNTFDIAGKLSGKHGENFMILLETRLDNLVYRLGLARTRRAARQLVNHGHILVDGKRVDIPSYRVKPGQKVEIHEKSKKNNQIVRAIELTNQTGLAAWVDIDQDKAFGIFTRLPEREEVVIPVEERLIVELYSK